jgi:hypothetical protein
MFPSFMAKDCKLVLVVPLLHIYNLILKRKEFPECWKISRITPVFKNGNKNEILNYRPISLICRFAKIFEFILHKFMYSHVAGSIFISQYGFFRGLIMYLKLLTIVFRSMLFTATFQRLLTWIIIQLSCVNCKTLESHMIWYC